MYFSLSLMTSWILPLIFPRAFLIPSLILSVSIIGCPESSLPELPLPLPLALLQAAKNEEQEIKKPLRIHDFEFYRSRGSRLK